MPNIPVNEEVSNIEPSSPGRDVGISSSDEMEIDVRHSCSQREYQLDPTPGIEVPDIARLKSFRPARPIPRRRGRQIGRRVGTVMRDDDPAAVQRGEKIGRAARRESACKYV